MTKLTVNSFSKRKTRNLIISNLNQNKSQKLKGLLKNNKLRKNRNLRRQVSFESQAKQI